MILHPDPRPAPRLYLDSTRELAVLTLVEIVGGPAAIGPIEIRDGREFRSIARGPLPACFRPRAGVDLVEVGDVVAILRDLITNRLVVVGVTDPISESRYIPLYVTPIEGAVDYKRDILGEGYETVFGIPLAGRKIMPAEEPARSAAPATDQPRDDMAIGGDFDFAAAPDNNTHDEYYTGVAAMRLRRLLAQWLGVSDVEAQRYLLGMLRACPDVLDRVRAIAGA